MGEVEPAGLGRVETSRAAQRTGQVSPCGRRSTQLVPTAKQLTSLDAGESLQRQAAVCLCLSLSLSVLYPLVSASPPSSSRSLPARVLHLSARRRGQKKKIAECSRRIWIEDEMHMGDPEPDQGLAERFGAAHDSPRACHLIHGGWCLLVLAGSCCSCKRTQQQHLRYPIMHVRFGQVQTFSFPAQPT